MKAITPVLLTVLASPRGEERLIRWRRGAGGAGGSGGGRCAVKMENGSYRKNNVVKFVLRLGSLLIKREGQVVSGCEPQ